MSERDAFEAKVHAKRETKDGIFLTFLVHPNDYDTDLAMLRVGASLIVGWEECLNVKVEPIDEKPVAKPDNDKEALRQVAIGKKPFHTLPLAQQCAIRCGDERFFDYLQKRWPYVWKQTLGEPHERAAKIVRHELGVTSRAELGKGNHDADNSWRLLEADFQQWLLDDKYADAIHR